MPDTGNDEGRDPPDLGALLELLQRGGDSFTTVRATYRTWRHHERLAAAFRADIEEQKRNSPGAAFSTVSARSSVPAPAEQEEIIRIWRDGNRVREEREGGGWLDGAYGVRCGERWWSWNSQMGAFSNQDDPKFGSSSVGEELAVMLDPTPLLGALRFAAVGRSTIAGRATLTARAAARPSERRELRSLALHRLGTGADHYVLEIDLERGILLEAVAYRDGKPFRRITTVDVVFDHPIADERAEQVGRWLQNTQNRCYRHPVDDDESGDREPGDGGDEFDAPLVAAAVPVEFRLADSQTF
ncbi:hypothetical protein [Candidatus Mycobacterium methanotrophicum]|uniref:Uncharacterized protein n=1 Tax=Candidatus Mycobacterium methanotrophicum TaxID=2943498 RepID=A0ABY4QNF1_9MYCO|nr:hypothetical protein [Candidatus Mycobacterium methanotrophicum]UQX12530.1 hypothetical protein M5I08_10075 [Candidatus Mycobacterium methanotrophicum]